MKFKPGDMVRLVSGHIYHTLAARGLRIGSVGTVTDGPCQIGFFPGISYYSIDYAGIGVPVLSSEHTIEKIEDDGRQVVDWDSVPGGKPKEAMPA